MDWLTIIGLLAAICTTIAFLAQVIKTLRTKQTADLSLVMYLILAAGLALWLIYGLIIKNVPIIGANSVSLVLSITVLLLKIKHG
jgi:MtN3 and saliva related transmembrane protein